MEATVNMPIVIQQRRQTDSMNDCSDFAGFDLPLGLEIVRRGNNQSYRLVHRTSIELGKDSFKHPTTNFAVLKDSTETTVFDTDFSRSVTQNSLVDEDEDFDDSFQNGIQVFEYPRKVLFSQEVEITTKQLKRWKPDIIIEPFLLDDDE